MRVVKRIDVIDPDALPTLHFLGDLHAGAPDFDEAALVRDVKRIAENPNDRWIGMGDYGDLITLSDKRYEPGTLDMRYLEAANEEGGVVGETVEHITELLLPIAGQCLGFLEGNHETTIWRHQNRAIATEIAANLNCQHRLLGYAGYVRWGLKRPDSKANGAHAYLTIHAGHGWQAPRRDGALVNQFELEHSHYPDSNIIARAHAHKRFSHPFDTTRMGTANVISDTFYGLLTGTYRCGPESVDTPGKPPKPAKWESRKMYRPKNRHRLGAPEVRVTEINTNSPRNGRPPIGLEVTQ